MKLKLYESYKIVWQDAWSTDIEWQDKCSVKEFALGALNHSIGYLVYKDRRQIVIATSLCCAEKRFSTITGIPSGCILKIIKLK